MPKTKPRELRFHEMKETDIHFRNEEFLTDNWHYPPGWYFLIENGEHFGPFLSQAQAKIAWKMYLDRLLSGTLPSQTGLTPKLDS